MKRNFGLDVLRSVSIWMVLLQHLGFHISGLAPLRLGGIGVEIFFVLSGFLIGGILFREIDKGNDFFQTLKSFWIRRWFRILPLYYALLLFKYFFIDSSIGCNIFYYIFFLQNNFYGIGFMSVSWSLVIEEWFYLFSPIFLYFAVRKLQSDKKIIASLVFFILLVLALRSAYVFVTNAPFVGINGNFPFRFDSLFCGVLLSFLNYKQSALFTQMNSLKVFVLGCLLFLSYLILFMRFSAFIDELYFFRVFGFLILPISISIMIPYISSLNIHPDKNYFVATIYYFFTSTSIFTYALYLTHPFVNDFLANTDFIENALLRSACSIGLTYLVSWLVYSFFERPLLNYRDKIQV